MLDFNKLPKLVVVAVIASSVRDRCGARLIFHALCGRCKYLRLNWDGGGHRSRLLDGLGVQEPFKFALEMVLSSNAPKGFELFLRHWALRQSVTRQYDTFHPLAFIVTIYPTLEMQTSSSEIRVLYPSFNAA